MLAAAGLNSRRRIEELVAGGRVLVNGVEALPGQRIWSTDRVVVDGKLVALDHGQEEVRVLLYHKPPGEIVSRDDPQGRPSVFDRLPSLKSARWIAVGRLDFNTSGLLMLTTSGELANLLMHPSSRIEREYAVRVRGNLSEEQVHRLCEGIELADGLARFERIEARGGGATNHWYHVVLYEGRNREVRRLFEAVDLTVSRLMRVRFGSIRLPPRLPLGKYVEMTAGEIARLRSLGKTAQEPEAIAHVRRVPARSIPLSGLADPSFRARRGAMSHGVVAPGRRLEGGGPGKKGRKRGAHR